MSILKSEITKYNKSLIIPVVFLIFLWMIQFINASMNQRLNLYGILPRDVHHLTGIAVSPFLHSNYNHLISNSFLVFLLSWIICFYNKKLWFASLFTVTLFGGLFIWIFGSSAYHVGASILIFGFFGTIFGLAFYHKKIFFMIAAIVLAFMYGGVIMMGLIPQQGISFAGHFGGLIAGFFTTKLFTEEIKY